MEAERRSTMSSLKGQLSNVEGSVKSMKAAVVVGSVLTVACLAAVFGVTVLANEVSKEVKVSNGTLATKSGKSVLTANTYVTEKNIGGSIQSVVLEEGAMTANVAVNAVVTQGETTTIICDELVFVEKSGSLTDVTMSGTMESLFGGVEKRNVSCPWCVGFLAGYVLSKALDWAIREGYECVTDKECVAAFAERAAASSNPLN